VEYEKRVAARVTRRAMPFTFVVNMLVCCLVGLLPPTLRHLAPYIGGHLI
jgi:hypothetical protein